VSPYFLRAILALRPPGRRAHIARVCDGDNTTMLAAGAGRLDRPRPSPKAGRRPQQNRGKALIHTGFCEFHGHPQLDLGQHLIELFVAGTILQVGRDGLQAQQRPGFESSRKKRKLEGV
jgi:hypothetical protein